MAVKGKVLNIEVGDRLTKVCLSIPRGKSYQIKNSFMFQTPDNAVSDGNISAPEALSQALRAALEAHGLADAKNAVFALTSGKVASREVKLPPVKDNRIKGIVDSNATEYFPVDLTKYHVTEALLERIDKGDDAGCRVLVFAAPLTLLEGYFRLAELSSLTVQAIDFSGNSQYQALKALGGDGATMYVNVDCNSSFVTFMQGGKLLLQRAFTYGGDELILNYMTASGRSADQYVAALHECSSDDPQFLKDGVMTPTDVSDALSRLVSSISRSTDYFNSNHWEMQVEKVVLMGPCSHLIGLREMVANGTGLPTTYLDEIPGITSFANEVDSASFYISCIGASIAPLDFIPPQFKADKKSRKTKSEANQIRDGAIICGVCVLAAVGLSVSAILGYANARAERDDLQSQIDDLAYTKDVYNTYLQYQAGADALVTLSGQIDSPNDSLTDFIAELEQKMPSQILVLSATCNRESVVMDVTVPDYTAAAAAIVQLRSFESLADVQVSSLVQQTDDTNNPYVSFTLTCTYGANPYLNGVNPYEYAVTPAETAAPAAQTDTTAADAG